MGDEVADRTPDTPPSQPVQSAVTVGRDVPLCASRGVAGSTLRLLPTLADARRCVTVYRKLGSVTGSCFGGGESERKKRYNSQSLQFI